MKANRHVKYAQATLLSAHRAEQTCDVTDEQQVRMVRQKALDAFGASVGGRVRLMTGNARASATTTGVMIGRL